MLMSGAPVQVTGVLWLPLRAFAILKPELAPVQVLDFKPEERYKISRRVSAVRAWRSCTIDAGREISLDKALRRRAVATRALLLLPLCVGPHRACVDCHWECLLS